MNVIKLRAANTITSDQIAYGVGFSLGEKRIDPHDVYLQAEAPKLLAPGRVHTVDGFVALGTIAETVAEQLQARRKKAQQDEVERLYRELTEPASTKAATWPVPVPPAPPVVTATDPAALAPTPTAEPERPHIPIDEMTLADYRRGIANVWRSYHGA